ncbi:MAG: ATP-binding protein [Aestuariibacter sp.]
MTSVNQNSVRVYIIRTVAFAVLFPVLILVSYFLYESYTEGMKQAEINRQQTSSRTAAWLRSHIYDVQYQTAILASNKAVGELPVNILMNQFTHNTLQEFVEENSYVKSAVITDLSDFILEGYPNEVFRLPAAIFRSTTEHIFTTGLNHGLPKLTMLSLESGSAPSENHANALYFVAPLFKELDSIVTPRKITGALYIQLDADKLFDDIDSSNEQIIIQLAGKSIASTTEAYSKNVTAVHNEILPSELILRQITPLTFTMMLDESRYLERLYSNLVFVAFICFGALLFALILVYQLISRLRHPLDDLRKVSQQWRDGRYVSYPFQSSYQEFDEALQTMNKMAETIDSQFKELRQAKLGAERSEALKSQFLANMSHEIRTPMNGVMGLLGVLQQRIASPEQHKLVNRIIDAASTLLTIVNDILDLSKIEADKLHIESVDCELKEILLRVNRVYAEQAKDKDLALRLDVKNLSHSFIKTDPVRVNQILNNLVSNAIKFTEHGTITIAASNARKNQQNYIVLTITDTGIGMDVAQINRLFNLFEQGDNSTTRKYGGTGLGLSICKKLANLMGGDIVAESEQGTGSKFTVYLQIDLAQKQVDVVEPLPESTLDLSAYRILVAEDNTINQEVLGYMLEETGISFDIAENGITALQYYQNNHYDMILMDVQMPEMDGIEATREIRKSNKDLPIIMQTANVMSEDIQRYITAGSNGLVAKPIVKQQLFTVLEEVLIHNKTHLF